MGDRHGRSVRVRGATLALGLLVLAPFSAAGASAAEVASPAPVASEAALAASPHPVEGVPADLFTRPPDPLTVSTTLAGRRRASAVIGPKGGSLKATGPDGTRYTLEIPKGAVMWSTTVRMTPINDVEGLPGEPPERVHGVQLEPDGLQLAPSARLTIRPRQRLGTEMAALDFEGQGAETGFHDFATEGRTVSLAIDHFSGYVVAFPLRLAEIQATARHLRTDPARILVSEIASRLAMERQRQFLGLEPQDTLASLAAEYLPLYREAVLLPRIAAAARGCAEAEAAMAALLGYEQQRQVLGVGDDPAYALPTGEGGTLGAVVNLPARLGDLKVRLCFREAHAQCVADGNFPSMATYFFSTFRQGEVMLGIEPSAEHIALAHGYLRRCGTYRTTVDFADIDENPGDFERRERFTLDIELRWRPGEGDFGMVGSRVDGEGDPEQIDFAFGQAGCRHVITRTRIDKPAKAEIEQLEFAIVYGPTLSGRPIPPEPRKLTLRVGLGVIEYHYKCGIDGLTPGWYDNSQNTIFQAWALGLIDEVASRREGTGVVRIDDRWTFANPPFTAERRAREPLRAGGQLYSTLVLDVKLIHEPT